MATKLEELEAEIRRLKEQIAEHERTKDYIEIWKLQSRYSHLYHMFRISEIPGLFAQKTPGVSVELEDTGVYEGIEGVKTLFGTILNEKYLKSPGIHAVHMTLNPIIEINKEGTRAKAVWHSHGSVTLGHDGPLTAFWGAGKYDMEYVKEDGQWKFLKLVYRLTYMTPYDKGWVEEAEGSSMARQTEYPPDKPTTHYMPYSRHRVNIFQPPPPEPYED